MQKIKHFITSETGKDVLIVIIVILVGLGSFGLGRLSKEAQNEGLWVEYANEGANVINSLNTAENGLNQTSSAFFASSKGTKYYSVTCSAGKTIKQENRVYFNTREEAEGAGYELSSSCR
jgi:hypothetical protein